MDTFTIDIRDPKLCEAFRYLDSHGVLSQAIEDVMLKGLPAQVWEYVRCHPVLGDPGHPQTVLLRQFER